MHAPAQTTTVVWCLLDMLATTREEVFSNNSKQVERYQFSHLAWVVDHHRVYDRGDTNVHHDGDGEEERKGVGMDLPNGALCCREKSRRAPNFCTGTFSRRFFVSPGGQWPERLP
jgi:hypothetical protein